jgi:hypothetical protein
MTIALETLLSSPDLLPLRLDLDRERILFAPLSAEEYRKFAFLDDRMQRQVTGAYLIDLKGLSKHLSSRPLPRPMHYILHGAHCCSTLLARCLETLTGCFVLKEPYLLTQIAILRDCLAARPKGWNARIDSELPDWFKMSTLLLNRTYGADDVVIVKANDLCNGLGPDLLSRDSRSKIVFLQSPLRAFLLSVLKLPGRRDWARQRLEILAAPIAAAGLFPDVADRHLSDAETAAALWVYNCWLCRGLMSGSGSERVLAMSGEMVSDQPLRSVTQTAEFFRLAVPQTSATQALIESECTRHAKDTSLSYDADARKRDRAEAELQFGSEAALGLAWARRSAPSLAQQGPFPPD